MKWSIKIARIAGVDLKIHLTFLIFLIWIGFTYFAYGGMSAALQGVLFIVLLFLCVVLHELGHALMASRFGIRTPDITLLPIGGVARLERIPEEPKKELAIAVAGPLVNVVIAAVLIIILSVRGTLSDLGNFSSPRMAMLGNLAVINIFLVLFNMIPAFPMDGGRVLRAFLAMKMDYTRATQIAATVGQGLAFVFGIIGLFYNPFLLFIALFVYLGASQEATVAQIRAISSGVPVSDAMVTQLQNLPATATVDQAAEVMLRTAQHEFPIVDEPGVTLGILTRDDIVRALKKGSGAIAVSELMQRDLPAVHPDDQLDKAFLKMQQSGHAALPVVDDVGRFVGLLTPENVGEMMMIRSLGPNGKPPWQWGKVREQT